MKCQFNRGIDQVKRQLSSTSKEMAQVPKRDGDGMSATLSALQSWFVFDVCMHGAVSTSTFDLINSIERMVSKLESSVRDSK